MSATSGTQVNRGVPSACYNNRINQKDGVQMKRAWIVQGGWEGHQPVEVAGILRGILAEEGFAVNVYDHLDCFKDEAALTGVDLIVPVWTMGKIRNDQLEPWLRAVKSGAGCAGLHGGMADAFRDQTEYQYMVGGQWVAHPGGDGVSYVVRVTAADDPVMAGIADFTVCSEQYYMHVDPANEVLATTRFGDVEMPVVWKKTYGSGKVFYCSLGHHADIVQMPQVMAIMRRGMMWAAR
jgi:type 1 glutamine amidotransferase